MHKPRKEHDPDKTRRRVDKSNITMPPEEKREWNGKNGGENNILREHAYNKC